MQLKDSRREAVSVGNSQRQEREPRADCGENSGQFGEEVGGHGWGSSHTRRRLQGHSMGWLALEGQLEEAAKKATRKLVWVL